MLFAQTFGEGLFWMFMFLSAGGWAIRKLFGQFDSKGAMTDAARDGIVRGIGRLFK